MPFVIVRGPVSDRAVPGIICEPTALGQPDRRTDLPVRVRLSGKRTLIIEPGDPREIVSMLTRNDETTFAVGPGTSDLVASVRQAQLQQASELSDRLRGILSALSSPKTVLDRIKRISDWLKTKRQ